MIQSAFLPAHASVHGLQKRRDVAVAVALAVARLLLTGDRRLPAVHSRLVHQDRRREVQLGQRVAGRLVPRDRLGHSLRQGDDDTLHRAHNPPCDVTPRGILPSDLSPSSESIQISTGQIRAERAHKPEHHCAIRRKDAKLMQ